MAEATEVASAMTPFGLGHDPLDGASLTLHGSNTESSWRLKTDIEKSLATSSS
jgi:hypothetical protein